MAIAKVTVGNSPSGTFATMIPIAKTKLAEVGRPMNRPITNTTAPIATAKAQALLARAHYETGAMAAAVRVGAQALAIFEQFGSDDATEMRERLVAWQSAEPHAA